VLTVLFLLPVDTVFGLNLFGTHKKVKDIDGYISIPVSEVNDGRAYYYRYKTEGKTVNFFVVKSRDNIIRAAFDACDVCFKSRKGYSQDRDFMICNNCGRRFHTSRINVEKGGCNPAPLNRRVVGDTLVIAVKDIIHGVRYF
jgi:uncharacterized membrane protein